MSFKLNLSPLLREFYENYNTALKNTTSILFAPLHKKTSSGDIPDWVKEKEWNDNSGRQVEPKQRDFNNFVEVTQNNYHNNIYVTPTPIYPDDRPPQNLPEPEEVLNQTPTTVAIGKPITLEQSIAKHQFGRLLYNPFGGEQKIRQVNLSGYEKKLEKLNQTGLEQFVKFLAKAENTDFLDACVCVTPQNLRGNSGDTGLVFGANYLKSLAAYAAASANNAMVGITDTIPKSYVIERYKPEITEGEDQLNNVTLADTKTVVKEFTNVFLENIQGEVEIGKCLPPSKESKGYSEYQKDEEQTITYEGKGFVGLNTALLSVEQKLTAMHQDICMAIDPPIDIPTLLPHQCLPQDENEKKSPQLPEANKPKIELGGIVGDLAEDQIDRLKDTLKDSALGWLLLQAAKIGGWKGVAASWFISYLAELIFKQQDEVGHALCQTNENVTELRKLIEEIDPVLAVPDKWEFEREKFRTQLIVVFRPSDPKNKSGNYSLSIPHYNGNKKPNIPSYKKGNHQAKVILKDNSKIVVNAATKAIAESVLKKLLKYVKSEYRTDRISTGEIKSKIYKEVAVKPYRADYYQQGKENAIGGADWRIYFDQD